jgi:hypothetical protein
MRSEDRCDAQILHLHVELVQLRAAGDIFDKRRCTCSSTCCEWHAKVPNRELRVCALHASVLRAMGQLEFRSFGKLHLLGTFKSWQLRRFENDSSCGHAARPGGVNDAGQRLGAHGR